MQIFKARNNDLDVTSESWRKASYKEMEERIPKTVRLPRKAIREVVVPIKKENTIEDLMRINAELLKIYKIEKKVKHIFYSIIWIRKLDYPMYSIAVTRR